MSTAVDQALQIVNTWATENYIDKTPVVPTGVDFGSVFSDEALSLRSITFQMPTYTDTTETGTFAVNETGRSNAYMMISSLTETLQSEQKALCHIKHLKILKVTLPESEGLSLTCYF